MKCRQCGTTLEQGTLNCPNCGMFVRKTNHVLGLIALVLAVGSILYNPWGIPSSIAIVLSIIGLVISVKRNRLKAFSIAGICVGVVSLAWFIVVTILD